MSSSEAQQRALSAELESVRTKLSDVGDDPPEVPPITADALPVEAMHYTVGEHYRDAEEGLPIEDERHFDGDLKTLFAHAAPDEPVFADVLGRFFAGAHDRATASLLVERGEALGP